MPVTNMKSLTIAIVLASVLGMLSGCTARQDNFLTVQLCLHDEQNLVSFINIMKSTSQSQGMDYGDNSAETQKGLTKLGVSPNYQVINIAAENKNGVGWAAGNLGLSAYEVALGFSEGTNPAEAHRFADKVVATLKQKWPVYVVPPSRGALPMKNCGKPGTGVYAR